MNPSSGHGENLSPGLSKEKKDQQKGRHETGWSCQKLKMIQRRKDGKSGWTVGRQKGHWGAKNEKT